MSGTPASAMDGRVPAGQNGLIPIQRELLADMLTPVSAYARLCPPGQLGFLLESVEGGERLARYSYIGYLPEPLDVGPGDPLPALARIAAQRPVAGPGLPRFLGGAVGFIGYEAARHFERLPAAGGPAPALPENAFMLAENVAVFDHVTHRLKLLTLHRPDREPYGAALVRLDEMEARLRAEPPSVAAPPRPADDVEWTSNVTRGQYESMVDAAREHILAGDAFRWCSPSG